ncbi:MAG: tRNA pseudouridine(38-40) synthase TruA [Brevinemataceae bacterium]
MKITYKLTLAYEGSAFKGWHTQVDVPTVQGTLNKILSELYNENIFTWGAGRTDSGAHALSYTAHFRTRNPNIPLHNLQHILNSKLPAEIRIYNVSEESEKFHATFQCKARTYCYIVFLGKVLPPRFHNKVYHEFQYIDFSILQQTLKKFKGTHDFTNFCYGYSPSERKNKTMTRRIDYFHVKKRGEYLFFFIKGEGFLRGMIRTLIGSSLSRASGILSETDIDHALTSTPLPQGKWKPVPAEGLYFKRAHF